jgi:hypothetical protein
MANTLIVGLPGNGKGVMAMNLIVEELKLGKRPIITNLAVEKWPWVTGSHDLRRGLRDYLLATFDDDFNCIERIFRVSDEAVQNFYLYRALSRRMVEKLGESHLVGYKEVSPLSNVLDERDFLAHKDLKLYVADHEVKEDKHGRGHCESFNAVLLEHSGPHFNVADECWKFWPARSWQSTSEADVFYNAQHRHFGDDNLFLTQRHNDIDSIIVERCQESIVMTHHGKLGFGPFRQPNVFTASYYQGRPMPSKDPMSRKVIKLDVKGLLQCYDTSAGVGITGRSAADVGGRKKSGLPFWMMPVIGCVIIAAVFFTLKYGSRAVVSVFNGNAHKVALQMQKNPAPVADRVPQGDSQNLRPQEFNSPAQPTNELFCTGYFVAGQIVRIYLSDGSQVSDLKRIQKIDKDSVMVDGKSLSVHDAVWLPADSTAGSQPVNDSVGYLSVVTSSSSRPVNQVILGPTLHPRGAPPSKRLNGLASMNQSHFSSQQQSAVSEPVGQF